ncbi:MAG: Gldg family protein [Planctomycetes bacterium]|nr:Gldg family protein [Planctomycetota bacterium]
MKKKRTAFAGILAVVVIFLAVNLISGMALRHARIDMTAEGLYSLSDGAKEILAGLDEPIRLDLYEYMDEVKEDRPDLVSHAQRIREFLEEMVLAADGKLELRIRKPEPYSEAEDDARAAGVGAVPVDRAGDRTLTLGLVATNSVDEQEVIPFFQPGPDKDAFLEYDLAKMVHTLAQASKPKIGVLSSLPVDARMDPANPRGGMTPAWQILSQLRGFYQVEMVAADAAELPEALDVLLLIHPRDLSGELLDAVDQFALGGGRILAFVDPYCQEERAQAPANPYGQPPPPPAPSDLGPLLASWGIDWDPMQVVGDRALALEVPRPSERGYEYVPHVAFLGLGAEQMADGDPVVGGLKQLRFAMGGALKPMSGAATTFEPLITTTADSMLIPAARFAYLYDHGELLTGFAADGDQHVVAARVSGRLLSAYPEREGEGRLAESSEDARIIVVADADLLVDYLWVQEERLGPILLGTRILADNGNLALNAVELLSGSPALASIRGNRSYQRPFDVVVELEREANERYRERESQLEEEIRQAEARINEMQREKTAETAMILSPEQTAEIDKLEKQMLAARKELRQVRHELNKEIEALGSRLMLANTVGSPLLVAALAFLWHLRRAKRKRAA